MNILGLNAFHGDASAALLSDGQLVSAIEEERLNRIKHWAGFPNLAAAACLNGSDRNDIEHVAISRDPFAHIARKVLHTAVRPASWQRSVSRVANIVQVARLSPERPGTILSELKRARIHKVEHHRAHLASAFFASPFDQAAVVSVDGFGDYSSVQWGLGRGNRIDLLGSVLFPHSLGILYTAFTQFLGFPKYGDEYKMMGLAAYGEPRFAPQVRQIVKTESGNCRLDLDYFTHHSQGVEMTWDGCEPMSGNVFSRKMLEVFGESRTPRAEITDRHSDLAASVQAVLEENYFALLNHVYHRTGQKALCLAGGVALNCAANGKIFEQTPFRDIYIQPAASDAGTSIGAALSVWHERLNQPRSFVMRHAYYGPQYSDREIHAELETAGVAYRRLSEAELVDATASEIAAGKVVGWFQGRMEFGPRALGNRSILADPRRAGMKDLLNSRIKHREHFRPFCPSVLAEAASDYFETGYPSPFMVTAYRIKSERLRDIPAVTHADGTGRLQTVDRESNPLYWKLIRRFGDITGVPVLLNTSFNENEPIVETPAQALDCFLRTRMDVLAIGPYMLLRSENLHQALGGRTLVRAGL
ncbi:MAG: carbamoyltransferase C-terminal domain-containing protein [Bryobacteraceae bacterium]